MEYFCDMISTMSICDEKQDEDGIFDDEN